MSQEQAIPVANEPGDGSSCFDFAFGAYGWTKVRVYADSLDDAFEVVVEWLDDNAPGALVSNEEFRELLQEAAAELNVAWEPNEMADADTYRVLEHAERDLTSIGHTTLKHGQHIASHEWFANEVSP